MKAMIENHSSLLLKQLPKGAFLTVKAEDNVNTMTIGWGHVGILWGKPVFIVYVRYSRYTYDLLLKAEDFTVNVPVNQNLQHALRMAGTKSGRDQDKFALAGLTPLPSKTVNSPILKECDLQYECRKLYQQTLEPALIDEAITKRYYPEHDTHVVFYGEILANYRLSDDAQET